MNIEKAIEILDKLHENTYLLVSWKRDQEALKLGIEALKQVKYLHETGILHATELLPGETKE